MLTKSRRRDLLKLAAGTLTIAASLPTTAVSLSTSSAAQWRSDLDHLYLQLQTHHRDLFNRSDRPAFDSAVAALRRDIPGMREHEVIAGFQRLTALAGDGHTFIFAWDRYQPLPFDVAWFDDGVRVVRTTPAAAELLGVTIQRLDGMEMREVEQRLDTVIAQGENAWYILAQRPNRLRRAGLLAALGIAKSMDGVVIEGIDREGRRRTVEVSALPLGSPDDSMTSSLGPDAPRKPDSSFAWTRLPQHDAMHVAFRSYADLPTKAEALFHAIKHDAPATLIIDLRENGGGNYILRART